MNSSRDPRRSGALWLLVLAYSGVGFSIYFSLGVVAKRGLGATPLVFLATGLLFVLTVTVYLEASSMLGERGGSSSYARHAFNELVAFIAGWAILLDYLIVIALAALSVPHYLRPITGGLSGPVKAAVIAAVIIYAISLNWLDITARRRSRFIVALAGIDLLIQLLVLLLGLALVMDPGALVSNVGFAGNPGVEEITYALVLATLAYAGIEAVANLVPDLEISARRFSRTVNRTIWLVPVLYALIAAVALMAVPVMYGPAGPETKLGSTWIEAPVLGIVEAFHPDWIADLLSLMVAVVAAGTLIWAANTVMFGVSRHVYTLAVNRQIPSWSGKLDFRYETPSRAIVVCGLAAFGLALIGNVETLAGIYAFGATLAITIGHLSIIRLRRRMPDAPRPFRDPLTLNIGPGGFPLSAGLGALLSGLALISVILLHDTARWVGLAWLVAGVSGYVIYRRVIERISLTERVTVQAADLVRRREQVEFHRILVPVFGTSLDDDIISTAGRMAAETHSGSDRAGAELVILQLTEVPLVRAIDEPLPEEQETAGEVAAQRALEVGKEYGGVNVKIERRRVRKKGTGIVAAARRLDADVIVMGAEPPSPVKGGARLGGIGEYRPEQIGPVTAYVLRRAPCRVILTAPPA